MNVKIKIDEGEERLFIDDKEVKRCTGLKLSLKPGYIPMLELSIIPNTIEVEGDIRFATIDKGLNDYSIDELKEIIKNRILTSFEVSKELIDNEHQR